MKKAAAHPTTKPLMRASDLSAGDVAVQFLDTTWRIAVPVVIFSLLGIFIDRSFETAPWFTLLGVILGFIVAGWLIKRQLDAVLRGED